MSTQAMNRDEKKLDKSVDMTFPASDPAAHGTATGTEPPRRPVDRQPPRITREQIEQASRGEGHRHQEAQHEAEHEAQPPAPAEASALAGTKPADQPDRETVEVRQGTGPRETVSVLLVSIVLAACAGIVLVGYFLWSTT
jgi:hypothetical protein